MVQGEKLRGAEKVARIPVKIIPTVELPRKPDWIRVRVPSSPEVGRIKEILRRHKLASVCEEAACPNLGECFSGGTATFMIMGEICTRRCPFCDVAHGRPNPLDADEPRGLAEAIAEMKLRYVVVTSVDRDDLHDGGAAHFAACIRETRALNPGIRVEVLVPDFRGRMDIALDILEREPPDVFNHNLETVPRLYLQSRPGSDYDWSLDLLARYKQRCPGVLTKSGLMLGLGETNEEVVAVHARPARPRRRHADAGAVPAAQPQPPAGRCASCRRRSSRSWAASPNRWAFAASRARRWCAPPITPTSRSTSAC